MRVWVLLLMLGASVVSAATPALMPMPARVEYGAGALKIDGNFGVAGDSALFRRFLARVSRQTGILLLPPGTPVLTVDVAEAAPRPVLGDDESYTLEVTATAAHLSAPKTAGVVHGLETFLQLIQSGPDGFQVPAVRIEDKPRFPWRGLMIDSSRHFMPLEVIERNLDAMAAVKLNVFHWHLSDDQGFRVESRRFPKLQERGSDGLFYTQQQVREVVEYARERAIRVVPEFDIPGHTMSWFPGYPELAAATGPFEIGRHFGVFDPVMDPGREEVYTFLDGFIGEMAGLFPDPFFHIGGDEVNGKAWKASDAVQAFAKAHDLKDTLAIQTYFNQKVQKILEKYGKKMIGWDEILGPDLPAGTVVQSWRGAQSLADAASKGYGGILSAGYYLDHVRTAAYHYSVDPLSGPAAQLTPEQAAKILGGEACMWAELVNAETVDSRIWPRMAAIAERLWSRAEVNDVNSMYDRLEGISKLLDSTAVTHRSGYAVMLDRLGGGEPVRVLAEACEARGLGTGRRARDTLAPLNRFVDAARPESELVRSLEQLSRKAVSGGTVDAAAVATLRAQFTLWAANDARFQHAAEGNGLLTEVQPLSKDLSALGVAGLRLLDYLESGKAAPPDFVAAQNREITRMQRPVAEVLLAGTRVVKILLDGVKK